MQETFNNVLDIIVSQRDNALLSSPDAMFRYLMLNYFFRQEVFDSNNFNIFLTHHDMPKFPDSVSNLKDVDIKIISQLVNGSDVESSLCGQIMLSRNYLKNFYPNHTPDYFKVPNEVRLEMRKNAKSRNKAIIGSFEKMHKDIAADKKRKVLNLVALVILNISRRTGKPLKNIDQPVEKLIKGHFRNYKELFDGNETQMATLNDNSIVRDLLKYIFVVKSYSELKNVSDMFMEEVSRFKRRADSVFS